MLALWVVVRELKRAMQPLGLDVGPGVTAAPSQAVFPPPAAPHDLAADDVMFNQPGVRRPDDAEPATQPSAPPPWHEETSSRERGRNETPALPSAEPAPKQRRNLLFSSTSRRERQRAETRATEANASAPVVAPPATESAETSPATFDDAWPKSERARGGEVPPQRRTGRATPTIPEGNVNAPEQPPVTVLKSGVVDGMAYSLYSDGSIEAQMPEGMMRFASIEELRAHLDHRA
jgi:hypothetical protein